MLTWAGQGTVGLWVTDQQKKGEGNLEARGGGPGGEEVLQVFPHLLSPLFPGVCFLV